MKDRDLVADEREHLRDRPEPERAALAAVLPVEGRLETSPESWARLAETGYADFARQALETAEARAAAIQTGELPYVADKAFGDDEVDVLGRAARVALYRDEPWLPDLLPRLLPAIVVAPTAARTVPSQRLLFELARSVEDFPTPEAVSAIRLARGTARHAGVPKQLDRMLKRIDIALAGRPEVALRADTLGFDADGTLRRPVGDYEALIAAHDEVQLTWHKNGKPLKGVPAAVRRDHGDAVKELRELVKRARVQLTTLTHALEADLAAGTSLEYGRWTRELLRNPLAGGLVRRLIWEVETAPGDWQAVLPLHEAPPENVPDDAAVRLWHPIRATADEVRAWRDRIIGLNVRQPCKQAFREIYVLTPAEEETRLYSNRFAAHIVHYRRLYALFRARGWSNRMLGPWDSGWEDEATRTLASGEWRVRLLHEYADWAGDHGLALTDQVRFDRRTNGAWTETPLAEVPPAVFSEAMRDVDLFVAVTSIAADPDWTDRGVDRARAYWENTGFGELGGSAQTRRDALERIVPRLKIADRCTIEGRFLTVRGGLRTYKIHLGSGNILMDPDDSYLCIVTARKEARGGVFLPFEDERLSLILSKAFLLADDTAITDQSILSQIKRGGR